MSDDSVRFLCQIELLHPLGYRFFCSVFRFEREYTLEHGNDTGFIAESMKQDIHGVIESFGFKARLLLNHRSNRSSRNDNHRSVSEQRRKFHAVPNDGV